MNGAAELKAFSSFKNSDPTENDCDFKFINQTKLQIAEAPIATKISRDRFKAKIKPKNETVSFRSHTVYISFYSEVSQ